MKTRWWRDEFKVGLMMIIGIALLGVMLFKAKDWRLTAGESKIRVRFDYVGGLLKNAPVHMYGLEIGKVVKVELAGDKVLVEASLRTKEPIREGYQILIDVLGLVGEKYIEIINGPISNPQTRDDPLIGISPISVGQVLTRAEEITSKTLKTIDFVQDFVMSNERGIRSGTIELKDFMLQAKDMLSKTMNDLDALVSRVNSLTKSAENNVAGSLTNLKTFTEELNSDREKIVSLVKDTTDNLNQLVTRTTPAIEESTNNFQKLSEALRDTTKKANQYIDDLNKSVSQLIGQLNNTTDSSSKKLQEGLDEFNKSAVALNEAIGKIDKLVSDIEDGKGTLGKLITDDSGYQQFNETMVAGKRAVENIDSITTRLDSKLKSLDSISATGKYDFRYNHLSRGIQNQLVFSLAHSSPYRYSAGLSLEGDKVAYDLQIGRKFGPLMARAGSIRSKAGVGLEYWPFTKHLGFSLEGVDVTDKHPQLDMDIALRLFNGWYFIFGAEDLTGSEIGYILGFRTLIGDQKE